MIEVGKEEGGFVGPELCKQSPGPSGYFGLGLANFGRGSVQKAVVRDNQEVLLNCLGVYFLLSLCSVGWLIGVVEYDEIFSIVVD